MVSDDHVSDLKLFTISMRSLIGSFETASIILWSSDFSQYNMHVLVNGVG